MLYILLNILVVSGGVQGGIEKFCNVGMPALFCLLVFIILYIASPARRGRGLQVHVQPRLLRVQQSGNRLRPRAQKRRRADVLLSVDRSRRQ
ncbi:MAG: hypothetical protein ACLSHG_07665 [Oscillospiraceae bacterium]